MECSLENIVGIKDGSSDLDYILDLLQICEKSLFTSDDSLLIPILASGGVGSISIVANIIPRLWKNCVDFVLQGNILQARDLYRQLYPIVKAMTLETNPQCVKYALSLMGKCNPSLRLPLLEPQSHNKEKIKASLHEIL